MKKLIFIIVLLLAGVTLVWLFAPVARIYPLFAQQLKPLQMEQLTGSLYRGQAGVVKWAGIELGRLRWNKQWPGPGPALSGNYQMRSQDYDVSGVFRLHAKQGLLAEQVEGQLKWRYVESFLHLPAGQMTGHPRLALHSLHYSPGGLQLITGRILLNDLRLSGTVNIPLGSIWVDLETQRPGLAIGTIHSDSSVLDASGVLYMHPHRFELNLVLKPKAGEYALEFALQNIGQPLPSGARRIQVAGFY